MVEPVDQPVEPQQAAEQPVAPHLEKRKRKAVDYSVMQGPIKRPKYKKDDLENDAAEQADQREQGPRWVKLEEDILVNFSSLHL